MAQIEKEYSDCCSNNYDLHFKVPTEEELCTARRVNRERTSEEKQLLENTKININELITQLQQGKVDPELVPELDKLFDLLGKK